MSKRDKRYVVRMVIYCVSVTCTFTSYVHAPPPSLWRYKNNALFKMKTAQAPAVTQLVKLKTEDCEPIEDQAEQLETWGEHYSKLYDQDFPEHPGMEVVLPSFRVYAELDEKLPRAISALSNRIAPGKDYIPAEILRT